MLARSHPGSPQRRAPRYWSSEVIQMVQSTPSTAVGPPSCDEDTCCVCFVAFKDGLVRQKLSCNHPLCVICARQICIHALARRGRGLCPICRRVMHELQHAMIAEMRRQESLYILNAQPFPGDIQRLAYLDQLDRRDIGIFEPDRPFVLSDCNCRPCFWLIAGVSILLLVLMILAHLFKVTKDDSKS